MKKSLLILITMMLAHGFLLAQKPQGYNLKKGAKIEVLTVINQVITQTVQGQNYETNQEIVTNDEFEVMEVLNNSYKIKMTGIYKTVRMDAPGQQMEMDSRKEGASNLAFKALTGKSFQFEMDDKGQVLNIEGLNEFHEAIKTELTGTALEAGLQEIIGSISEETLTSQLNGQFYIYPNDNETTWERTLQTVSNNLPVNVSYEFNWDTDNSMLAAGEVSLEGSTTVQGMAMSTLMKGTQNSIFDLDNSTGLCTQIQTQQDMKGQMEMQGMSIPMETKTNTKVSFKW